MPGSTRAWLLTSASYLCAAAPFVAGGVRYVQTGRDTRLLWAAVASALGACGVEAMGGATVPIAAAATIAAALALVMRGAGSPVGVGLVAIVLGSCWAVRHVLARTAVASESRR
jgi:hypothetical protein